MLAPHTLVRDHARHAQNSRVSGGGLVAEHVFAVKYVQSFVFHCSHCKIGSCDDIVLKGTGEWLVSMCRPCKGSPHLVHVANAPVSGLVKRHAILQSTHCNTGLALAAMWHIYVQADRAAVGTRVRARDASEISGNKGKKVRGNAVGAVENGVTMAIHDIALEQIAVCKHDRELLRVAHESGGETGHHVGAIDEIGDVAETFSLALRDERSIGAEKCEYGAEETAATTHL